MHTLAAQSTILGALAVAGFAISAWLARQTGLLSFRVIAVVVYTITMLVSGFVHATNIGSRRRGYFDAVNWLDPREFDQTILVSGAGLIAIAIGASFGIPSQRVATHRFAPLYSFDRRAIPLFVALVFPIAVVGLIRIREYAGSVEVFGGRIISVTGGLARYSYISSWAVWVISLFVIWYSLRLRARSALVFLLLFAVFAIAVVYSWSGARSTAAIMAFPLILVVLPQLRLSRRSVVVAGSAFSLLYISFVAGLTSSRYAGSRLSTTGLTEWLDWEWGRFSLLGWAVQFTDRNGFLLGETYFSSALRLVDGFVRLSGAEPLEISGRSSMSVAAEGLLHSRSEIYVVPGLSAELFLNFGLFGVVMGYLVLGRLCGWVDERFSASVTAVTQLAWAFVGSLLVFRTIASDSLTAVSSLVWTGAPLLLLAGMSYLSFRPGAPIARSNAFADCQKRGSRGVRPPRSANGVDPAASCRSI